MDEEDLDNDVSESLVIGRYDSGQPFGSVLELIRCGECDGLYKQDHHRFIMGMYIAPTGQDAIKRRKRADEHNRKLDEIFIGSKLCYCHGRNSLFTWRHEE
jgi:hypothetical protein